MVHPRIVFMDLERTLLEQDVKLSLKLKDRDITILHGITGYFSSRTVTAILGPSGCGKSSLLDIISMRKTVGTVSGRFELAGVRMTREHVHQSVGYVEQKHALLEHLTVKEHFQYVAALKLSKESQAERDQAVEYTLANLELTHQQNTIIQSNERGLSGGEQKRVAVGIAMLTRPRVLLLDEPTSGLDSIASLGIFHMLAKLSSEGIAIACTVHSPHNSAFATFDNLMLLLGGRMAYFGPCRDEDLRQHFESPVEEDILCLRPPAGLAMNPSFGIGLPDVQRLEDRTLDDVISMEKMSKIVDQMNGSLGIVDRVLMAGNDPKAAMTYEDKFKKSRLFQNIPALVDLDGKTNIKVDGVSKLSKTSRVDSSLDMGLFTPGLESIGAGHSVSGVDEFKEIFNKSAQDLRCPELVQCSFLKSVQVLFEYTVLVKLTSMRYWMERAMDKGPPILIFSVIAASMGRREDNVSEVTFFMMSIVGFLAFVAKNEIMAAVINERPVFERERSERLYKPEVYTIMVILKELPIWTLTALWHIAIPYLIFGLRGSLLAHCGTAIVLTIACGIFTALAAAISSSIPMGNIVFDAYILGMLVPTQGALFRIKVMPAYIRWVHVVNPLYYAFASHMKIEQQTRGKAGQDLLNFYGMADVRPQHCIVMICMFALFYFVLLALSVRFINHQKR